MVYIFPLLLIVTACHTLLSSSTHWQKKEPWLTLEKTSCYGTCPQYTIAIYPDRRVIYKGRRFVKNIGTFEKRLSKTTVAQIEQQILQSAFFEFEETYDNEGISDLPSVILYCKLKGREKKVIARINAPAAFFHLVSQIEGLIGQEGYKRLLLEN